MLGYSMGLAKNENGCELCECGDNPLSPTIAIILAQGLQRYNSPADWASKLLKPSTDSASLLVEIEIKIFSFWVCGSLGEDVTSGGVIFILLAEFRPSLRGPGRQSNWPIVSLKLFLETRLSYKSLEPLIDFLAYLDQKLCHTNQKVVKLSNPTKGNQGLNNIPFVYGQNSSLE